MSRRHVHLAPLWGALIVLQGCVYDAPPEEKPAPAPKAVKAPERAPLPPKTAVAERPPSRKLPTPEWNERTALELVTLPLSCIDRPQQAPRDGAYLYTTEPALRKDYEETLAFYGCSDWHSAVNSTWTLVKVLKEFPEAPIAPLIREKLNHHLSQKALEGERTFFADRARAGFERPYGWAWLLKLYQELHEWNDPDSQKWAQRLRPLAQLLAARLVDYLDRLSHPLRVGTHANTAFALHFALDYARSVRDLRLDQAVLLRSRDFFLEDTACPMSYEPSGSDFLSPCLAEAVLMSRVLSPSDFLEWFESFMPAPDSPELESLGAPIVLQERYLAGALTEPATPARESPTDDETRLIGSRSHLIGLAFVRAAALRRLAEALPQDDRRREVYGDLASRNAARGFEAMYDAAYLGTHWLSSFAVYMLAPDEPAWRR
jgi:hypothetical protein